MGFLGILEPRRTDVPVHGSVRLADRTQHDGDTHHLKHATGKNAQIVLVPQPSEDVNDPLNWHPLRKLAILCIVAYGTCLYAAVFTRLTDAGTVVLAITFERSIPEIVRIGGYQLLLAGCLLPFVSAASRKWGKRPVFIISALFGLLGSILGAAAPNFECFYAARLIQGAAIPAYEALIGSMIADLYFVHQRGAYMGIVGFVTAVVANLAPTICGPITSNLGWKYLFYLCCAFVGLHVVLLVLFVPETQYRRPVQQCPHSGTDSESEEAKAMDISEGPKDSVAPKVSFASKDGVSSGASSISPPAKTLWANLAFYSGVYTNENLLELAVGPFAVGLNLLILWSVIASAYLTATFVAQASVMAQIFVPPPYSLNAAGVGYLYLGPFVGGTIASILFALAMDPLIKACSKRNGGVYEPEYRLLFLIGGLVNGAGLFGWGALTQNHGNMYGTAVLSGFVIFGVVMANNALYTYALDSYQELSSEIFVASAMVKNFMFFGFSYFISEWVETAGPATAFYIFGGVSIAVTATGLVFFLFGKLYRAYWARHDLLAKFHVSLESGLTSIKTSGDSLMPVTF